MQITQLPRLAFLGPEGTYTHQAAYDRFGDTVVYVEKNTIADTFNALSSESPLALVPQENSIFGPVVETYDLLRSPSAGSEKFVRDEVTLKVQHCLLVRRGVKLQDITTIYSHEQALGQCTRFLESYLPDACVVKTASTAAAAQKLLSSHKNAQGTSSSEGAAICSGLCASLYAGLEVLEEGIQNEDTNYTRFWLLSTSQDRPLPSLSPLKRPLRALLRVMAFPSTKPSPCFDLMRTLDALQLRAIRIDRRPSAVEIPFHDVYFVELEKDHDQSNGAVENMVEPWESRVKDAAQRIRSLGCHADVLGIW